MTLPLSKSNDDAGEDPLVEIRGSALSILARRLGASFTDAIIFGTVSAATVCALMGVVKSDDITLNTLMMTGALAFIDVLTLLGFFIYILALLIIFYIHLGSESAGYQCIFLAAVFPLNLIYHVVFERSLNAATPGKRLFGLKLESKTGGVPGVTSLLLRHFTKILSTFAIFFPVVLLLFATRHQLLHDRIAGVKVIEKNASVGHEVLQPSAIKENILCAGLWRRVPAAILDSVAFNATATMIVCAVVLVGAYFLPAPETLNQGILMSTLVTVGASFLSVVASVLAMAWFEASRLQATPGKVVMGLKVTNTSLGRITMAEAIHKQLLQGLLYINILPVFVAASGALVYFNSQLLFHSELFKMWPFWPPIILWGSFYTFYGLTICGPFFKKRQTLVDVLSHRYVLDESQLSDQDRLRLPHGIST